MNYLPSSASESWSAIIQMPGLHDYPQVGASPSSAADLPIEAGPDGLIDRLRKSLLDIVGAEVELEPYALLDYPAHANAGDSAIWLGQLALLRKLMIAPPSYVCAWNNCDNDYLDSFDGQIFLQGGGNFGDLWPKFHGFRLSVLRRFRARRIVQLPQSIHFDDPSELEITRRVIGEHGNYMLFVRDEPSLEVARTFDCDSALVPDSAFMLDLKRIGAPICDVLYLHRDDKERVVGNALEALPTGWEEADWSRTPFPWTRFRAQTLVHQIASGEVSTQRYRETLFEAVAAERVRRAAALLSRGRRVATDRLHAHILSTLMNIPHVVLDNSYGKVSGFASAWGTADRNTPGRLVRNIAEAEEALRSL